MNKSSKLKRLISRVYKRQSILDPTQNYNQTAKQLAQKYKHKIALDVGSGTSKLAPTIISLDKFTSADITADAQALPIQSNSVDCLINTAVLEHTREPQTVINECHRVLKTGGEVYFEVPFLQPFHASPHDYFRVTLPGLKHWCRSFSEISSGVCVGPGSTLAWISAEYSRLLFGSLPVIGLGIEVIVRLLLLPLKWLDRFLITKPNAHITASAVYFHGRKK